MVVTEHGLGKCRHFSICLCTVLMILSIKLNQSIHSLSLFVMVNSCTLLPQNVLIHLNTLRPRRNGQHFADDIFKHIFFNENVWILIKISLKFVRKGPVYNIPALVQIMAWRRPLSEPMMDSLPTHICVTLPQWVNSLMPLKCKSFDSKMHLKRFVCKMAAILC